MAMLVRLNFFQNSGLRETKSRCLQILFSGVALTLLLIIETGCSLGQFTANRLITAPNLTALGANKKATKYYDWDKFQKTFLPAGSSTPFVFVTIPVGPPDAKLNAVILPPQDYHVKVISKVSDSSNPKLKRVMSLNFVPATNSVTSLKEPATIVILHGYSMTRESMVPWALMLAQVGYRVVLVDLRGHGQSTGAQVSFGKFETADLTQMLDYLIAHNLCDERVGVLGLSYGATLGLHWAAHDSRVRTAVAIAPYNQPDETMQLFVKEMKIPVSQKTIEKALVLASTKLEIKWDDWSGETAIRQLKEPVLLIGGGKDTISRPKDIEMLKQLAPSGSKAIQISEANHFVIGYWFHELGEPVKTWFDDHLGAAPKLSPEQTALISVKPHSANP